MLIGELTTREVHTCRPGSTLADAGKILRDCECGALPVVDDASKVVGIVTDRDVALALAERDESASKVAVADVMKQDVHSCRPQDDIEVALQLMGTYKVRRLPVCDDQDRLLGILSIDDLVLSTQKDRQFPSYERVLQTLRLICEHYRDKREEHDLERHPTV